MNTAAKAMALTGLGATLTGFGLGKSAESSFTSNGSLPAYSRDVRQFKTVTRASFSSSQRKDRKIPFSGEPVAVVQTCPAGYVDAKHPTIRNYDQQVVTSQVFVVKADGVLLNEGRALAFVESPKSGQVNYWTLGKDTETGWDTNVIVVRPSPGTRNIEIVSTYEGYTGSNQFDPSLKTGVKLSASEEREFLRLDEMGFKTTKEAMNQVLSSLGLSRGPQESPADYSVRLERWTGRNIRYLKDHTSDDV